MNNCRNKSKKFLLSFGAISAVMGAGACATSHPMVVTGYIETTKTDDNDNPVDINIWDDKRQYDIVKKGQYKPMLDFVDHKVSAKGQVKELGNGKSEIEVESFQVID